MNFRAKSILFMLFQLLKCKQVTTVLSCQSWRLWKWTVVLTPPRKYVSRDLNCTEYQQLSTVVNAYQSHYYLLQQRNDQIIYVKLNPGALSNDQFLILSINYFLKVVLNWPAYSVSFCHELGLLMIVLVAFWRLQDHQQFGQRYHEYLDHKSYKNKYKI